MGIFTFLGILAAALIGLMVYLFSSYSKRVNKLVCDTATEAFGFSGRTIIVGTIAHNESEWLELLTQLRSEALTVREAAVVASAWIRDRIPRCENQNDMQSIVSAITTLLREDLQRRLAQGSSYSHSMDTAYTKLDKVMRREGISITE